MKKTITLLLATAGFAMGAEPIALTWTNGTADLTGVDFSEAIAPQGMTVAATLNWDAVWQTPNTSNIFQIHDGEANHGVGLEKGNNSYIDPWINGAVNYDHISIQLKQQPATTATLVYTSYQIDNEKYQIDIYLTLWDTDGNAITPDNDGFTYQGTYAYGYTVKGFSSPESISYNNALVNNIMFFNDYFIKSDVKSLSEQLYNASIPEPATATLSLLALAGLAARRRR